MTAIFNEVCELNHLQVLKIDIEYVNSIKSLQQLYHLQELQLSGNGGVFSKEKELQLVKKLKVFASLSLSSRFNSLTKLSLHFPFVSIPESIIKSIGKRFPTVKCFKITAKFFPLHMLLHSFVGLESLTATYTSDEMDTENYYNRSYITIRYPNMKHFCLDISNGYSPSFLSSENFMNLLQGLPGLESLQIAVNFKIKTSLLEDIFNALPFLTVLVLVQDWNEKRGNVKVDNSFITALLHRQNLLKFVLEDKSHHLEYEKKTLLRIFSERYRRIECDMNKILMNKQLKREKSFTEKHFK
jgi:hypothetical protein